MSCLGLAQGSTEEPRYDCSDVVAIASDGAQHDGDIWQDFSQLEGRDKLRALMLDDEQKKKAA